MPKEKQNRVSEDEQAAEKERRTAEHFTRGVLARGEAARLQDGELPAGVTHEIVEEEEEEEELPKIRRRRFSFF